jgi:hypothetical protein
MHGALQRRLHWLTSFCMWPWGQVARCTGGMSTSGAVAIYVAEQSDRAMGHDRVVRLAAWVAEQAALQQRHNATCSVDTTGWQATLCMI